MCTASHPLLVEQMADGATLVVRRPCCSMEEAVQLGTRLTKVCDSRNERARCDKAVRHWQPVS